MLKAIISLYFLSLIGKISGAPLPDVQETKLLKFNLDIRSANEELTEALAKRDTIVEVATDLHQVLLTFPFNIAGQSVTAVVDTGSYSTWLIDSSSSDSNAQSLCSSNSCIEVNDQVKVLDDDYTISYMGDFGASGKWATAPVSISGVEASDFKFGLADSVRGSSSGYAWSGFGYSSLFTSRNSQMLDILANGGAIDNKLIALEYGAIESWSDNVMGHGLLYLGGYDGDKANDLHYSDFVSEISSGIAIQSVTNNNGDNTVLANTQEVLFDSGSTNMLLKSQYYDALFGEVKFDADHPQFFKCSDYKDHSIKLEVNGKTLTIPILNLSWNNYQQSYDLCQLMVGTLDSSESYEIVFGQYTLKNLVTVIDVDGSKVGLAANADGVMLA